MTTTSEPTPPNTTATSPPAPASTRRQRRSAFASAWLGWGLDGFETYAIVLVSSFVVADLIGPNSSAVYVATIVAVQLVAWALGGLASGVLIDYFGRRRLLMYSIVLYTVATALSALSPNFAVFLILRVIAGFGMGAEWGPGSALVAETWPDRSRGKGLALLQSAFGFGFLAATGTFFLLQQIDGTTTWRWMLAVGAVPALLLLFLRSRVHESPLWETADQRRRDVVARVEAGEEVDDDERALTVFTHRRLFADPVWRSRMLKLLVLSTASLVGWWAVSSWIPQYARGIVAATGGTPATVTLILLAYNVGGVIGWLAWGVLADAVGRRWTLWSYYAGALVMTWVLFGISWSSIGWLTAVVFVNGIFTLGQMGWMATYPGELFPTSVRGSAITIVFNASRFLAAAGALLSGAIIAGLGGISVAALTIGSIYVLGLVFSLIVGPETRGKPLPR